MAGSRADALTCLDVFVGEWVMEARFPGDQPAPEGGPQGHSRFEWDLDQQFLMQRTEVPVPDFAQRFTGTFSADGNTVDGAWEKRLDGAWQHDFALTYRRAG